MLGMMSLPLIILAACTAVDPLMYQPPTPPTPPTAPESPRAPIAPLPPMPQRQEQEAPAEIASITPERLIALVGSLPTKRGGWGSNENRRGLDQTRKLIVQKLTEMGYAPRLEKVTWSRREVPAMPADRDQPDDPAAEGEPEKPTFDPYGNVIVEIKGTTHPREVLVIGAHFDAVPVTAGADDNGSGVAALLEMARVLKGRELHRTVRLVFFDLEEARLVGATQHVTLWREGQRAKAAEERERIVGMVSLEMLGYYSETPGSQRNPFKGVPGLPQGDDLAGDFIALVTIGKHSSFVRALDAAARGEEAQLKTVVVDQFPIAPPDLLRSDHAPFLFAGVPAVMATDTANYRNKNYHQPTDTVETLHPELYARTVRGLVGAVLRLAGPTDKPMPVWRESKPETKPDGGPEAKPEGIPDGSHAPADKPADAAPAKDKPAKPAQPAKQPKP